MALEHRIRGGAPRLSWSPLSAWRHRGAVGADSRETDDSESNWRSRRPDRNCVHAAEAEGRAIVRRGPIGRFTDGVGRVKPRQDLFSVVAKDQRSRARERCRRHSARPGQRAAYHGEQHRFNDGRSRSAAAAGPEKGEWQDGRPVWGGAPGAGRRGRDAPRAEARARREARRGWRGARDMGPGGQARRAGVRRERRRRWAISRQDATHHPRNPSRRPCRISRRCR